MQHRSDHKNCWGTKQAHEGRYSGLNFVGGIVRIFGPLTGLETDISAGNFLRR